MASNETQRSAEAGEDQSEEEERNDVEMPRLPDTALRQIFNYLDFSDIKSCRLVSSQWHRFALDNVNFVLSIQHLQPTRRSERTAISSSIDADDDINRYRNRIALFPYSTRLSEKAVKEKVVRAAETAKHTRAMFYFHQLPGVINDNFQRKIKHVIVRNVKPIILPILQTLTQLTPVAGRVYAFDSDGDGEVPWAAGFDKEKQTGDFRCRGLGLSAIDAEDPANSIDTRLLAKDANFISRMAAESWWCLQQTLSEVNKTNNNREPLVLDKCLQLFAVKDSRQPTIAPFRSIVAHFPNLQQLHCTIGFNDPSNDIESLEQLADLKYLSIGTDGLLPRTLPKLCLPNLTELTLGIDVLLPTNHRHFDPSGLKKLSLHAHRANIMRLTELIDQQHERCFSNLRTLTTTNVPAEVIVPFLGVMLASATNLQKLETMQFLPVNRTTIIPAIYTVLAAVAPGLTEITIGTFCIPNEAFDCRGLVQQLIDDVKQRSLKTTVSIVFNDNAAKAMIGALAEAGVGGDDVTVSELVDDADYDNSKSRELTWHNNAAGIPQKLKIQVSQLPGLERINQA